MSSIIERIVLKQRRMSTKVGGLLIIVGETVPFLPAELPDDNKTAVLPFR